MKEETQELILRLSEEHKLSLTEYRKLLDAYSEETAQLLRKHGVSQRKEIYGESVYVRGLIEFSNVCKNNCYYCGIRRDNTNVERYRLSDEQIFACCKQGYELGYRTFVLQSGEDPYYSDEHLCKLVGRIHKEFPDCAITLSLGERDYESYLRLYEAGARRYLLRHETADQSHYESLHPASMSWQHRMQCLRDLKQIGYQVGCGFMVGSPGQNNGHLAKDLKFIEEFQPDMCGIGPFVSQKDTPFGEEENGSVEFTCYLLSMIRLIKPNILLPATTALGTLHPLGRELGIQAGANVVMPNLSPVEVRDKYALYDNKLCTGDEAAECRMCMERRMNQIGYFIVTDIGNAK